MHVKCERKCELFGCYRSRRKMYVEHDVDLQSIATQGHDPRPGTEDYPAWQFAVWDVPRGHLVNELLPEWGAVLAAAPLSLAVYCTSFSCTIVLLVSSRKCCTGHQCHKKCTTRSYGRPCTAGLGLVSITSHGY
jgi:hypothetical protein